MEITQEICPECNGDGWVVEIEATHGCGGDENVCSHTCPVPMQVQVGCYFCLGTGVIEFQSTPTVNK